MYLELGTDTSQARVQQQSGRRENGKHDSVLSQVLAHNHDYFSIKEDFDVGKTNFSLGNTILGGGLHFEVREWKLRWGGGQI